MKKRVNFHNTIFDTTNSLESAGKKYVHAKDNEWYL